MPSTPTLSRTISILGAGAIGAYYGTRLRRAGHRVRFFEPHSADAICRHGITVSSGGEEEHFGDLEVCETMEALPPAERVFICLKTTQNHLLEGRLADLLTPDGIVVTMQNGLGLEEDLRRLSPRHPILAALCFISVRRPHPNRIEHLDYGQINLAEHGAAGVAPTRALDLVAAELRAAGIPVEEEADLETLRWKKLLWNIPFNGLSVLLRARANDLAAHAGGRQLVSGLMDEVFLIAAGLGKALPARLPELLLQGTAGMKPYETSLQADFAQRRPMELETMFRRPLAAARGAGIAAPRLEFLLGQLAYLEEMNLAAATPAGLP